MMNLADISAQNAANIRIFAWWGSVMVLKILACVLIIGRWRWGKGIFITPEDAQFVKMAIIPKAKVVHDDPDVERSRRAHLNDLENILPWAISTALWLTTSPDTATVALLIKVFSIARIIHTIVYAVIVVPQPARFLSFLIAYLIIVYQSAATIYYYS
ncbi:microsomal glutathione S-transferase 1-like [Chelonus insularis]|uniref:microsomal glutathione S-transferase 1-like n=1 Tax=Chelonus insularis TaxID=460826 RepID=UPI00158940EE|nr:microsomal glutathione S-transferase 1-like [Chelonus insularis]